MSKTDQIQVSEQQKQSPNILENIGKISATLSKILFPEPQNPADMVEELKKQRQEILKNIPKQENQEAVNNINYKGNGVNNQEKKAA